MSRREIWNAIASRDGRLAILFVILAIVPGVQSSRIESVVVLAMFAAAGALLDTLIFGGTGFEQRRYLVAIERLKAAAPGDQFDFADTALDTACRQLAAARIRRAAVVCAAMVAGAFIYPL